MEPSVESDEKLIFLPESILAQHALPSHFTFPFFYEPHPLALFAAGELQRYLTQEAALDHNFGLDPDQDGLVIGKMFGILLVQDRYDRVGYLSAFSGKLAGTNEHARFVPPVFDMLREGSFFLQGQDRVNALSEEIARLEQDELFDRLRQDLAFLQERAAEEIFACKALLKARKQIRDRHRENAGVETSILIEESLRDKRMLRTTMASWEQRIASLRQQLEAYESKIEALKAERRQRSADLQQQLFHQYSFLNAQGLRKSLHDIFSQTAFGKPPSAAGECATPKLLQYAFLKGYRPLAMAEFWWGASPKSEIRKHAHFYPACTGKCKPILAHMLEGLPVDENPLLRAFEQTAPLTRIYEDESLILIDKPSGLRSVPGVAIEDSAFTRLKAELGTEALWVVHRLDMDTSGLLLFAKSASVHRNLQRQFLRRSVHKRYVALLEGFLNEDSGEIDLPLAADPFDRPRQRVCYESGKPSLTEWRVIERCPEYTRVVFSPHTGRTHQLRVHAAHPLGLAAPIKGDDLYGSAASRLFLHAAAISFVHPITKARVHFEAELPF